MKKLLVLLSVFSISCSLVDTKTQNLEEEITKEEVTKIAEDVSKEEVSPEVKKQRFIDLISPHTYLNHGKEHRIDPNTGDILEIDFVSYEFVSAISENKALYRHRLSADRTQSIGFIFDPSVGLVVAKYLSNDIFNPKNIDFSQTCGSKSMYFTLIK